MNKKCEWFIMLIGLLVCVFWDAASPQFLVPQPMPFGRSQGGDYPSISDYFLTIPLGSDY